MPYDITIAAQMLALGLAAGFLAGLLGVGGGMLMVPFMTLILSRYPIDAGLAVKMAIATSMATILFTSISSLRAHHKLGAVSWPLVRSMAPGIIVGGLASGAGAFALLKGALLASLFGVFVAVAATQMLLEKKPEARRQLPGPLGEAAAGAGIGFISGLLGAGGAFMSVPFMTRCNVPIHRAVATSAALGLPIALGNTVGYLIGGWNLHSQVPGAVGYLVMPALALIALGSVTAAPLGARAAHRLNMKQLRRAFAFMLYGLSAYMLWHGLRG
jgi:uncharacterized membrane protein YfcA